MAPPPTSDYVRTERPDGSVHFRLPDREKLWFLYVLFAMVAVTSLLGMAWQGFWAIAIFLFFFMIFGAPALERFLFRGRVEILVTKQELQIHRQSGPFWRRWHSSLDSVRKILVTSNADGLALHLDAEIGSHCVRVSSGEPADLLRRLQMDLAESYEAQRISGLSKPGVVAEQFVLPHSPGWRFVAGDGVLRLESTNWFHFKPFEHWPTPGSHQISGLQRLVVVDQQLVAVLPDHRPWILAQSNLANELQELARKLVELCRRAGTPLVEPELESDWAGPGGVRLRQPVFSVLRVEQLPNKTIFYDARMGVRYIVDGQNLRIEWRWFFLDKVWTWHADEIRTIEAIVTRCSHSEGGDWIEVELRIHPWHGAALDAPRLSGSHKDYEWLATTLRVLLFKQEGEQAPAKHDAPSTAIQVVETRLTPTHEGLPRQE